MVEIEKHVNPPLSPLQPFKDKIDEYVEIMFAAAFWIPFPIVYSRDLVNLEICIWKWLESKTDFSII